MYFHCDIELYVSPTNRDKVIRKCSSNVSIVKNSISMKYFLAIAEPISLIPVTIKSQQLQEIHCVSDCVWKEWLI